MSGLDRSFSTAEKNVLPFVMAKASGSLYCLPLYFIGQPAGCRQLGRHTSNIFASGSPVLARLMVAYQALRAPAANVK
jgi:hypothetical protein